MISIYDAPALEKLRAEYAVQPHRMKVFRTALFKHALSWQEALDVLPDDAQAAFADQVECSALELVERHDSKSDGASKLIFRTKDNHLIESVILRPKSGRTALCISSQVGCACACSFCATGEMGFLRHLTQAEILDQVLQSARLVKAEARSIRNVVFMGMGEPLLNSDEVFAAIRMLISPQFFNLSGSRVMVSTVGIADEMIRFKHEFPTVQLALSLHSARQSVREELIPVAKRYDLDQLRTALCKLAQSDKVMIEYLMLAGVNDQEADLEALKNYLHEIPVHINIIPFNVSEGSSLRGTSSEHITAFSNQLKAAGFQTTVRYSLGADIVAACGQLVQRKKERE